ncbi:MAG: hypothetical protein E6356_13855 [Terrisporobacter othiniensis]|nr:hypothetical protein [Terrisporobacter othiniensis]
MGRPKINRLGEIHYVNSGHKVEIIEYKDANHVTIMFEDKSIKTCGYKQLQNGEVSHPLKYKSRLGEINKNRNGHEMEIIKILGNGYVEIEFKELSIIKSCSYKDFKEGNVVSVPIGSKKDRTGEESVSLDGYKMKIIKYILYSDILVQFEDGTTVKTDYKTFKNNMWKDKTPRKSKKEQYSKRIGLSNRNFRGELMTIIEYRGCKDIDVKFEDGHILKHKSYGEFKNGGIQNPYFKTQFNKGYIGEGEYNSIKNKKSYYAWKNMLTRCYSEKYHEKHPNYKDCTVCEEWHNFQNFAKWYEENYYEVGNERMHLDKDILVKGNKVYSPITCIIVPQRINDLFTKRKRKYRNPKCITHYKSGFKACCNGKYSKPYNTEWEAFQFYKRYKKDLIKNILSEYKAFIPKRVYDCVLYYKIEITD